ncbi:phosphatase PAP2 family protein [Dysgonomonas sp. Marseille-P4361]|uniref:phosphatase PAP2 family protein n=1 Tax=Dysgonomonas sp. Marseille-P4361 TaxID=2161820 RepID=UPI000D550B45|nr:phosphatase PAP2 family protein [Dysgonomonas sp. Marseille-P4361]
MLEKLIEWDKELFLFLNSKNIEWLDPVMLFLSSYLCWTIVFFLLAGLIYWYSKTWKKTSTIFFMLTVGMSALLTNIIKLFFERPRPIHNQDWVGTIHAIEDYSSSFSFFSSHSATTFSMSVFFFLCFKQSRACGVAAIVWSALVAYSRIYVAKHYPFDVIVGILFGTVIGIFGYMLLEQYKKGKGKLKV